MVMLDQALDIARIAMTFGEVDRATTHPDGRPESDTTHSIMLALLVAPLAEAEGLDPGLAVQFAVVHDLVEVYALDTCTARGLTPAEREAKQQREAAALARLRRELGADSWVIGMIVRYEQQVEAEARLVRYADKVTPKLTHILNRCASLRELGMTRAQVREAHVTQGRELAEQYPEFVATRRLFEAACSCSEEVANAALEGRAR